MHAGKNVVSPICGIVQRTNRLLDIYTRILVAQCTLHSTTMKKQAQYRKDGHVGIYDKKYNTGKEGPNPGLEIDTKETNTSGR